MLRKTNPLDFEIAFFEPLVQARPHYIEALLALAEAYTRKGFHDEGYELDKRLSRLCPDEPAVHYNLACSCALLGRKDEALQTLKRAIELGYSDFGYMKKDADLKSLHGDPRFHKIFLH